MYTSFYRRFIKDFSKIARLLTNLLAKDVCDALDFAIGIIFGQRIDNKQHVIYYSSRTLNDAQLNYTITEKEFLAIVFALEKFRHYLLGFKTTIFTNHSALRYLWRKKMLRPN